MDLDIETLARAPGEPPAFRRRHLKPDGRELLLYGLAKPDAAPVGEGLVAGGRESELRYHPLRGEWAVYAAARQGRTFKPSSAEDPLAPMRAGGPETEIPFPDYEIAVFENRFPSFSLDASSPASGPFEVRRAEARGRCDVVVYSSDHEGSLATLDAARRRLLVDVWIDRYEALFAAGCAYVLPFENRGEEVGVTLHHPHGQIYAFGFVPEPQARAAAAFAGGYSLCARLKDWRREYEIASEGGVVAFAPPFARFPYEVWLAAEEPREGPWAYSRHEKDGFALLLGDMTRRYDALFGRTCPYMMTLHAAPQGRSANYEFTAQFYPLLRAPDRIKYLASVEQATGVFTVDVGPEQAAAAMRSL